jgi:hypothetical protein
VVDKPSAAEWAIGAAVEDGELRIRAALRDLLAQRARRLGAREVNGSEQVVKVGNPNDAGRPAFLLTLDGGREVFVECIPPTRIFNVDIEDTAVGTAGYVDGRCRLQVQALVDGAPDIVKSLELLEGLLAP